MGHLPLCTGNTESFGVSLWLLVLLAVPGLGQSAPRTVTFLSDWDRCWEKWDSEGVCDMDDQHAGTEYWINQLSFDGKWSGERLS